MKNYYEQLRDEKGEDAAKEYMRSIRGKVKHNKGGGFNDPTVRKKALETRRKHVLPKNTQSETKESL